MRTRIRSFFPHMLFFILSLAPFFWNAGIGIYTYLGSCDFSSAVDIVFEIKRYLFTYDPYAIAGYETTASLSALFPYHFIMWICALLRMTPLVSVLLFISILLFLSQLSMFSYLREILQRTLHRDRQSAYIWAILGGGLYGFCPYPIGLVGPGHFLSMVLFALFPWILLWYTRFLEASRAEWRTLLMFFVLFISCVSGAAYSISILYVLSIVLFAYAVFAIIFIQIPFWRTIKRVFIVLGIMVLANAWWLVPFLVTQFFSYGQYAASPLMGAFGWSTEHATIGNIFLGRAEGQLYDSIAYIKYFRFPAVFLFFLLAALAGYAVFQRRKYPIVAVLFGMLLLGVFISKGTKEPFEGIFLWLYSYFPGFQIFRRPINKFYWEFFFFLIVLAMSGMAFLEHHLVRFRKFIRLVGAGIFAGGIIWLWYSFTVAGGLRPYNIPQYYEEARKTVVEEKATRIFLLPGTLGLYPLFNKSANNYNGIDFLYELWKLPVISPDPTDYSLDLPYKKLSNMLMRTIVDGKSFCNEARALGISHIVLRDDYSDSVRIEMPATKIRPFLDTSVDIETQREFGDANGKMHVYTMKNECRTDLVYLENASTDTSFLYTQKNPVQIVMHITDLHRTANLVFLQNYSQWWKLYVMPADKKTMSAFLGGKQIPIQLHSSKDEFANLWTIDPEYIKKTYGNRFYEEHPDGSIDINLMLYFQPQLYYYLGISLTLISVCIIVWKYKEKNYDKKTK